MYCLVPPVPGLYSNKSSSLQVSTLNLKTVRRILPSEFSEIYFIPRTVADILSLPLIRTDVMPRSSCFRSLFKQIIFAETLETARRIPLFKFIEFFRFISCDRRTVAAFCYCLSSQQMYCLTLPVAGFCSNKPSSLKRWKLYGRIYCLSSLSCPDLFHVKDWSWHSGIITSHQNRRIA